MDELQLTGGARIGRANISIPLATLTVSKERMELNASIVGNLTFQPADITSIEPYNFLPVIGQGVKINHRVPTYKEKVIFWSLKDPMAIIKQIEGTGFLGNQAALSPQMAQGVMKRQAEGGFPIKRGAAIAVVVFWNLLFLADVVPFILEQKQGSPIGAGMLTAIGLVFLIALLSLVAADFRRLILKEGRGKDDIKRFAIFLLILMGVMFVSLSLVSSALNAGEF